VKPGSSLAAYGRHDGFWWCPKMTLAGMPSARSSCYRPPGSRSSRIVTTTLPLACVTTVHAASKTASGRLAGASVVTAAAAPAAASAAAVMPAASRRLAVLGR